MNPHPDLSYRITTLDAERDQRRMELVRIIREHRDGVAARPAGNPVTSLWRRLRRSAAAASAPATRASTPVPCDGAHAHA